MPTAPLTDDELRQAYDFYVEAINAGNLPIGQARPGNSAASYAAKQLRALTGLTVQGAQHRIRAARRAAATAKLAP